MLKSPENILGYKMKVRLFSLSFDCNLCEDVKPLVGAQDFAWLEHEHRVAWDTHGLWDIKAFPTTKPPEQPRY